MTLSANPLTISRSYFECQPCDRQFATDEALQSHLEHSSRHFWCNPCNRVFNSEEALESHLSTAKAHRWCYTCSPCNQVFNSEEALESHLLTSEAHTWCYTCNRGFISAGALQSHMRNAVVHRYALANSMNLQVPSTAPKATHGCAECNISFKEPFQLREVSIKIYHYATIAAALTFSSTSMQCTQNTMPNNAISSAGAVQRCSVNTQRFLHTWRQEPVSQHVSTSIN